MNTFTSAEMDWLREIGGRFSSSRKKAEKIELLKCMTKDQTNLLMDWISYRMTGKRPVRQQQENGKGWKVSSGPKNTKGNGLVILSSKF